jgi:hypothetical protein
MASNKKASEDAKTIVKGLSGVSPSNVATPLCLCPHPTFHIRSVNFA